MAHSVNKPGLSTESLPPVGVTPQKKRVRRKHRHTPIIVDSPSPDPKVCRGGSWDGEMRFGTFELPWAAHYYRSHDGLALHGRLSPLFTYPVEVLANCRKYRRQQGTILGSGRCVHFCVPPPRHPGLSLQEFYTLYAEDLLRYHARLQAVDPKHPDVRRYRRNLEVLRFMRATWDALLMGYQTERLFCLTRYGTYHLNSVALQGINRFRAQLIDHPVEAAARLKSVAQANRLWYYGGPKPRGRLLVVAEKRVAMAVSYIARALPPAPPDPAGLEGLLERLTSEPPPERPDWRVFVKAYLHRFRNPKPCELYTMPSPAAALGITRQHGGHNTGVQHLVLLGYALTKIHGMEDPVGKPYGDPRRDDGSWLELISHSLHPKMTLSSVKSGPPGLFSGRWEDLEKELPEITMFLQAYLRKGVFYVLENLEHVPILPISAEEKGLKTRFPTCTLTAVNLVQQILRRVIDSIMVRDPRCARALGASEGINLAGEPGPYYAQDASAATDYHPQWLTQTVYEELAELDERLRPYKKFFNLLFGVKKIFPNLEQDDLAPHTLLRQYPNAPLLITDQVDKSRLDAWGHASNILQIWNDYLMDINSLRGTLTTTGQMMGDPTSFPILMLVSIFAGEQALISEPYGRREGRKHPGLRRGEFVAELVGDDANIPRWTEHRRKVYNDTLTTVGTHLSLPKCFWHPTRGLIAEVPTEHGRKLPHYPLSILVAPPGGSKGQVMWHTQPSALKGDPGIPQYVFGRYFLTKSPYYYTWKLADKMGLPLAAPEGYGGIGLSNVFPKASQTHQVEWLRYLSVMPLEKLISGTALSIGRSTTSLMAPAMTDWLEGVVRTHKELVSIGGLLDSNPLDDTGQLRVDLGSAYRAALSTVRSAEFYFRAPPEILESHAPSVAVAAAKFQRKVSSVPWFDKPGSWKYGETVRDLERKTALFFSRQGSFLPDTNGAPRSFFGLEQTGVVKRRFKAPHLLGVG